MSRPSTAGSYRTSASTVGDHGQRSKFATVKSRYSQSASKQRPASAPVTRKAQVKSGTATASKILRHNGDIFAVKYQHKLTGYKLSQQLGEDVKAECTTSNQATYKKPQMPTLAAKHKTLAPYHMHAGRSRLPPEYPNEAKRYVRYCHERNVSQLKIGDSSVPSITQSASHVFHRGLGGERTAGTGASSSHPGIFAVWTKRHKEHRGL
eukprot:TRINITY_DN1768_c0_g1_i1.p1 TRINITY_DN1768_c0_g1~~TRINITY_DN1768_c0_g1_i1.p1  ORF type:complete len:208 (+),score=27.07 TRINITY_DN1768_c0_g1_i1:207-830(+)